MKQRSSGHGKLKMDSRCISRHIGKSRKYRCYQTGIVDATRTEEFKLTPPTSAGIFPVLGTLWLSLPYSLLISPRLASHLQRSDV